MKTLIAVIAGTAIMASASTQAKFIETDSPNNPTVQNELGVSMVTDAIPYQGYSYLAQQQAMAKDRDTFYPTTHPLTIDNDSRTASITTNHDIARYLSVQ